MFIQKLTFATVAGLVIAGIGIGVTRGQGPGPAGNKKGAAYSAPARSDDRLVQLERKLDRILEAVGGRDVRIDVGGEHEPDAILPQLKALLDDAKKRADAVGKMYESGVASVDELQAAEAALQDAMKRIASLRASDYAPHGASDANAYAARLTGIAPPRLASESDTQRWERLERRLNDVERRLEALERSQHRPTTGSSDRSATPEKK
jgi:hypothetical protein